MPARSLSLCVRRAYEVARHNQQLGLVHGLDWPVRVVNYGLVRAHSGRSHQGDGYWRLGSSAQKRHERFVWAYYECIWTLRSIRLGSTTLWLFAWHYLCIGSFPRHQNWFDQQHCFKVTDWPGLLHKPLHGWPDKVRHFMQTLPQTLFRWQNLHSTLYWRPYAQHVSVRPLRYSNSP